MMNSAAPPTALLDAQEPRHVVLERHGVVRGVRDHRVWKAVAATLSYDSGRSDADSHAQTERDQSCMAGRLSLLVVGSLICASTAAGQNSAAAPVQVELAGNVWNPSRQISLMSGTIRCVGSTREPSSDCIVLRSGFRRIDFVERFVLGRGTFGQFSAIVRLPGNQRVRLFVVPTDWEGTTNINGVVDFQGISFGIGDRVTTQVKWTVITVGYRWDALANRVASIGLIADVHHHSVAADIIEVGRPDAVAYERSETIPTVGVTGGANLLGFASLSGELTLIQLNRPNDASVRNFDVHVTTNVSRHLGARVGFRSMRFGYGLREQPFPHQDMGNLRMKAPYLGGVVRF